MAKVSQSELKDTLIVYCRNYVLNTNRPLKMHGKCNSEFRKCTKIKICIVDVIET